MFTVADLQTLVGQVKPEGVICMISLSINEEQTEDALALLCQRSIRYMRENIFPLTELHNYTCTTGLFIKIIDKGKHIIQQLLASFATLFGIQAPAHADTATPIETQAALPALAEPVCAPRAQLSYIHDHSCNVVSNHEFHEMNEAARAAQRAELDRRRVKGQNRAAIEADPWCTAEVIAAAFQVARANSDKADPTGLAVWLLLKDKRRVYRDEINAIAAGLSSIVPCHEDRKNEFEPEETDDLQIRIRAARAEIQRLETDLQTCSFGDRRNLLQQREAAYKAWRDLLP